MLAFALPLFREQAFITQKDDLAIQMIRGRYTVMENINFKKEWKKKKRSSCNFPAKFDAV